MDDLGKPLPFICNNTILNFSMQSLPVLSRLVLSPELPGVLLIIRANDAHLQIFSSYGLEKLELLTLALWELFVITIVVSFTFFVSFTGTLSNYFRSVSFRAVIFNMGCTSESPRGLLKLLISKYPKVPQTT